MAKYRLMSVFASDGKRLFFTQRQSIGRWTDYPVKFWPFSGEMPDYSNSEEEALAKLKNKLASLAAPVVVKEIEL